ncbi:UvrD-helicase domain-containing protein [Terrisporobacter petrolearius]
MCLKIIKNDGKELTTGEKSVLNKVKKLYQDYNYIAYLYIQPNIGKLVPDFILIDENKGLAIIEVKDWSTDYIKNINKRTVQLVDRDDDNPVFKTKKYLDIAKGIISTSDDDIEVLEDNLYANTVLVNMSDDDIRNLNVVNCFNQRPIKCLTKNLFDNLKIDDLFSDKKIAINEDEMILLRTILFPETKIKKTVQDINGNVITTSVSALDTEQENFARRLPYGHYMVTGVPGSGKTVILIARALHIAKEHPDWNIQILTYNKSLSAKIGSVLNSIAEEIKDNNFLSDIPIENINAVHFHKLAMNISNVSVPKPTPNDWWDETLPSITLEKSKPIYDAVLIDEYQDFRDSWIKVCINICKKHTYINNSNKEVSGINLFLAGDRLQSIYNSKVHNWSKDFGLNMAGRSKLLKTSYRAGRENIDLALKFLQNDKSLLDEVNKFYKNEEEKSLNFDGVGNASPVEFLEGSYNSIVNTIRDLLKDGYKYNDILLICHTKGLCKAIHDVFPECVKNNMKFVKDASERDLKTKLLTSTYHSSKGLEAKVVVLVDANRFISRSDKDKDILDRKLLYVGMTRASEKLFIHSSSFDENSFAQDIKNIYEENLNFA